MSSALQEKKENPIDIVRAQLKQMEEQFKMVLPSHVTPEKFTRIVLTAIQKNPEILEADRKTLFQACMNAATDGLLCDGREAAMVVYRTKNGPIVSYQPMVQGILKKVRNSGELQSIAAHVIYEKEEFDYWVDVDGDHLKHKPNLFGDKGSMIGVYALAKTKDGGTYIEVMSIEQVEKVRNVSRAKDMMAWKDWYDMMALKTVIRRLAKRLPMSTDVEKVIQREDELYDFEPKIEPTKNIKPIEYLPDFKPRMTVEQLVTNFKDMKNFEEVFFSVLEKYRGTEWEKRLLEELEKQGVVVKYQANPQIQTEKGPPPFEPLPFEKEK